MEVVGTTSPRSGLLPVVGGQPPRTGVLIPAWVSLQSGLPAFAHSPLALARRGDLYHRRGIYRAKDGQHTQRSTIRVYRKLRGRLGTREREDLLRMTTGRAEKGTAECKINKRNPSVCRYGVPKNRAS